MEEGNLRATECVFRTVYYVAKSNRPFTDHEELVVLQTQNGIDLGLILHSRFSATSIVEHVASEMKKRVMSKILALDTKIAVLIDEATTSSSETVLAVHLKCDTGNGKPVYIFLDLVQLEAQTSETITAALLASLKSAGFTEEFLSENWIAFASDGASVMLGERQE